MSENEIVQVFSLGNKNVSEDMNYRVITSSVRFIKYSERFDESLSFREKLDIISREYKFEIFFTFCISVLCNLSPVKSNKV